MLNDGHLYDDRCTCKAVVMSRLYVCVCVCVLLYWHPSNLGKRNEEKENERKYGLVTSDLVNWPEQVKRGETIVDVANGAAASSSAAAVPAAQKGVAEASMMAKALASLTAGAAPPPTGASSAINKPAILSAIVRNASGRICRHRIDRQIVFV